MTKQILEIEEIPDDIKDEHTINHYNHIKRRLKEIEEAEIEGYKKRIKFLPTYEQAEPDISFFAKLEKRKISQSIIGQLAEDEESKIHTDKENILRISTNFYTNLYTPEKTNTQKQDRLLRNIKNKITNEQKEKLDADITEEEVKKTIFQMEGSKSRA